MSTRSALFAALLFALALRVAADSQNGPKNAVVLIIRHAENPDSGRGLSPRGEQRAEAYKDYFQNFNVDSKQLTPNVIFAAKDSRPSGRPRLTVEPFANTAGLEIDSRFGSSQSAALAAELQASQEGKRILICWRHGQIPDLLRALGAEPETVLPNGKWPGRVYDQEGHLIPASPRRINQHLLPGDSQ
jgi:hypothetical protein